MKTKKTLYIFGIIVQSFLIGCGNDYLDLKPSMNQRVPSSINDLQAILDNSTNNLMPMNVLSSHYLGIISGGEYIIGDNFYNSIPEGVAYTYQKKAYIWEDDIYIGGEGGTTNPTDYDMAYQRILYCNIVLDFIDRTKSAEDSDMKVNQLRGDALFRRAQEFYNLAQLYCEVYTSENADNALGISIRLNPSTSDRQPRSTLKQTYDKIREDLLIATDLLPELPLTVFRPSKISCYSLLSRVYLQLGEFDKALNAALNALTIKSDLNDFNEIPITNNYRFPLYGIGNPEVIYSNAAYYNVGVDESRVSVDTLILKLYSPEDLRNIVYFREINNKVLFYGSYYGNRNLFTGYATNELYLTVAECFARLNEIDSSLKYLNDLLKKRINKNAFNPVHISNRLDLIKYIVMERKKELILRGIRWEDIRRLNKESELQETLHRVVNNQSYYLHPNSKKWVNPIPLEAIWYGDIEQNKR